MITVGHRTISGQLCHVSERHFVSPVKMSDPTKRAASSLEGPPAKKRSVMKSTADKWIADNDKALSTSTWLRYDTDTANRGRIVAFKCCVCYQFRDKLIGMRNYSAAYIEGSSNLRASSFKEHAASVMHAYAMLLLKKKQGSANLLEYAPIAKALLTLDDTATARIKRKFDIAYMCTLLLRRIWLLPRWVLFAHSRKDTV